MRTGSKRLHSLVTLLLVATERRRNAPKRGGAAGPKVDSAFAESSVAGFAMDVALCVLFVLWYTITITIILWNYIVQVYCH